MHVQRKKVERVYLVFEGSDDYSFGEFGFDVALETSVETRLGTWDLMASPVTTSVAHRCLLSPSIEIDPYFYIFRLVNIPLPRVLRACPASGRPLPFS